MTGAWLALTARERDLSEVHRQGCGAACLIKALWWLTKPAARARMAARGEGKFIPSGSLYYAYLAVDCAP
jgi:hypothetical protein